MNSDEGWDVEVGVTATVRIRVKPNDDYFEGWLERTPLDLAMAAVYTGRDNPARMDGFADLIGDVDIIHVEEAWS